jgi:hypothetical protein
MGDEGKAAGCRIPAVLLSLKTQTARDALKVESARERKQYWWMILAITR